MKLILDFDDVLFNNIAFKEQIFTSLEQRGVERGWAEETYKKIRDSGIPFSLKDFLRTVAQLQAIPALIESSDCYEEVMSICPGLINSELVLLAKELGAQNVFIVTSGDDAFQRDKIRRTLPEGLVSELYVVPGTKRDVIKEICDRFSNQDVIFVDDKVKFFNDIEMKEDVMGNMQCANLKTVWFNENGISNLQAEMEASLQDEKERRGVRKENMNNQGNTFGMH